MADQWDYPYHQMKFNRRRGQKPWYTRGQHNPADVHWIEKLRKERDFAEMLLEDFSGYASHYGGIVLTETEDRKVYRISSHSTRRGDDHSKATGTLVVDIPKDAHGQVQIKLSLGGGVGEIVATGGHHDIRAALISLSLGLREVLKGTPFEHDDDGSDY